MYSLFAKVVKPGMPATLIELDAEALAAAAAVLGTKTADDTVNGTLREVAERLTRLRAVARLGEMADRGDFNEFLSKRNALR